MQLVSDGRTHAGKEGPFVHIASCIGNIVSRFFSKYELNEGMHNYSQSKRPLTS